jgi:hypothetical protein
LAEPTAGDRRQCPTRESGVHALIAHWITPATCLERQRRNYHKCFACLYRGLSATAVLERKPEPEAALPRPLAGPRQVPGLLARRAR